MTTVVDGVTGQVLVGHTLITNQSVGVPTVRHYGPSHVVEGSMRYYDLPVGETLVVRHLSPYLDLVAAATKPAAS